MKKFYYIHGYSGTGKNKSKHLSEILGVNVTPLNYDSKVTFDANLELLSSYFENKNNDTNIIIASSLGCFYAVALYQRLNCIDALRLFNPCLNPKTALLKIGCDEKIANSYDYDIRDINYSYDVKLFVSTQDEVLENNLDVVKEFCVNLKQIYTTTEKHQMNDFTKYKDEILKFKKNAFTKNGIKKLNKINNKLNAFENKFFDFLVLNEKQLMENGDFKNYMANLDVYYFDSKDEIITIDKTNSLSECNFYDKLAKGKSNQNEFEHRDFHPLKDEFHCWLYHCLYDHNGIDFTDILDVKYIRAKYICSIECASQKINIKQSSSKPFSYIDKCVYEDRIELLKINDVLKNFQDILINKAIFYENKLKKRAKKLIYKWF